MKSINIGLIGLGTVGTGVYKLFQDNASLIEEKTGIALKIKKIAVLNIKKKRGVILPKNILTRDANQILEEKDIDIIVELIGGIDPAREFILKAFKNKKHVVTANKALLAKYSQEIFPAAEKEKVEIGFEASVGGCIPIIRAIKEGFAANRIELIYGIVNGTANYILSKMSDEGQDFSQVLKEAQAKGYAEADPTFDIEGIDSAHKLLILANLAFGSRVKLKDVYVEGISRITPFDIDYAREFGYRIKLLAIAKLVGAVRESPLIDLRVHPTMIPIINPISNINGILNAIKIKGDFSGENLLIGQGAGSLPTASAVVSDIIDIARNIVKKSIGRVPLCAYIPEQIKDYKVKGIKEIFTRYYLRFSVVDKPGVLSRISGILGDYSISIAAVIQKGRRANAAVPLVIMTHTAKENDIQLALKKIEELKVVLEKPMLIRVEDGE